MKTIVIKVNVSNEKQKQRVLRSVSCLRGIDDLSVDHEKGTLTVTGTIDPVCIIKKLRLNGGQACLDTVKDPPKKEEPKKKDDQKKDDKKPLPEPCPCVCHPPCPPYPYPYPYHYPYTCHVEDVSPSCAIL